MESSRHSHEPKRGISKSALNVSRKSNKASERTVGNRQYKKSEKDKQTSKKRANDKVNINHKRRSGSSASACPKRSARRRSSSRQDRYNDNVNDKRSSDDSSVNMSSYDRVNRYNASKSPRRCSESMRAKRNESSAPRRKRKKNTNPNNWRPRHFYSDDSMMDQDLFRSSFAFSALFGRKSSDQSINMSSSEDSDNSPTSYEDVNDDDDEEGSQITSPGSSVQQAGSKKSAEQKEMKSLSSVTWFEKDSGTDKPSKESVDSSEALPAAVGRTSSRKRSSRRRLPKESDDSTRASTSKDEDGAVVRTISRKRSSSKKRSKKSDDSARGTTSKDEAADVARTSSGKRSGTKRRSIESGDFSTGGDRVSRKGSKRSDSTRSSTRQKTGSERHCSSMARSNRDPRRRSRPRSVTERSRGFSFRDRDDDLCKKSIPAYSDCIKPFDGNYHKTRGTSPSRFRPPSVCDSFRDGEVSDRGQRRTCPFSSRAGFHCASLCSKLRERASFAGQDFDTNRGNKYTEGATSSSRSFIAGTRNPALEDKYTPPSRQRSLSLNPSGTRATVSFETPLSTTTRQKSVSGTSAPFSRAGSAERMSERNGFSRASSYASVSHRRSSVNFGSDSPCNNLEAKSTNGLRSRNSASSFSTSARKPSSFRMQSTSSLPGYNNTSAVSNNQLSQNEFGKTRENYYQLMETFKELNPFKELSHLEKAAIVGIAMSLMEAVDSDDTNTVLEILEELRTKIRG